MNKLLITVVCVCILLGTAGCPTPGGGSNDWIIGGWIMKDAYGPHSNVSRFFSDGTFVGYSDYAETQPFMSGTWELNGNILSSSDGSSYQITRINDDHYTIDGAGITLHVYRKGFEPDGSIFTNPETVLTANVWTGGSIASADEVDVYTYTATSGGIHTIEWDDSWDGSGNYSGDIMVTAYGPDQTTILFEEEEDGYQGNAMEVNLTAGTKIYIIVEQSMILNSGTYAVRVNAP
jgi:hypothetical protein